jgi:DNA-binding transcriptional LysR family regulator
MNWDHIKTFLTVARSGSVAAAAKALEVNHTTIIRRLEKLDDDLAVRLFDHAQTGYQLTEIGGIVFARAERMEEIALAVERDVRGRDQALAGTLKVAQPENAFIDLSTILLDFKKQFPLIDLVVSSSPRLSNLDRFEADVAIRLTNAPPLHLIGKKISAVNFSAYASRAYAQSLPPSPRPGDGQWLLWLGTVASASPELSHPAELLLQSIPEIKVALRSNSMADILAGVTNGMGIGLLSTANARHLPDLVELPFTASIPEALRRVDLWLLTHPDLRGSARVQAFTHFFAERFAQDCAAQQKK